mgnify:CR=1 FL=1
MQYNTIQCNAIQYNTLQKEANVWSNALFNRNNWKITNLIFGECLNRQLFYTGGRETQYYYKQTEQVLLAEKPLVTNELDK